MHSDYIIDNYIKLIEEDPEKYKKDYDISKEYIAGTNAYQFGNPVVFNYQPIFISQKDVENFQSITRTTLDIGSKVLKKYLKDEDYRKLFDFPDFIEEMILVDPGYDIDFPMTRIDVFYKDRENFKLCEINTDGASGMNADNVLAKSLLKARALQKFSKTYELSYFELFDSWVEACLEIYEEFDPSNKTPNVAIIDLKESVTGPDFEDFVKAFERAGLNCKFVDVRDVEYRNGALYHGDYKIDLVYRRLVTFELIEHAEDCQEFIRAYKDTAMCVIGSLRTQIIHNKLFFKILFDFETKMILTQRERDFIDDHVPYTGILGEKKEDIQLLIDNKDNYIIKPMDKNVSTGVYAGRDLDQETWERKLEEDAGNDYIFQEFVEPYYNKFVKLDEDGLEIEELTNMMGLFSYNHKFVGTYNRMGRINVIKEPGEYIVAPGMLAIPRTMNDILPRINELAALAKERELTAEETVERHELREEYLRRFRAGFRKQLLSVRLIDEKGNDLTPEKAKKEKDKNIW